MSAERVDRPVLEGDRLVPADRWRCSARYLFVGASADREPDRHADREDCSPPAICREASRCWCWRGIGYLAFMLALNVVMRVYLLRDLWARVLAIDHGAWHRGGGECLGQRANWPARSARASPTGSTWPGSRHERVHRWITGRKIFGAVGAGSSAIYFDGKSSRRRLVTLAFADRLELREPPDAVVAWPYADIRRADSPSGMLRVTCLTRAGVGAARDSRCGAGRRTDLRAAPARRKQPRPARRGRHRRLVAGGGGFDRRGGAVRRAAWRPIA